MARTRQPRRHLLSVIRQKVSPPKNKHNERGARSQGGGPTPLANPHRFLACPLRKFGLATCSAKLLHPTLGRDLPLASRRQRGTQRAPTSCVAPPGVAEARATHWVAISQLATKKLLRPTNFVRALAEIDQTTLGCLVDFLLQQSRAGAARHAKAGFFSAKLRWRRPEKRLCPTVIVRAPAKSCSNACPAFKRFRSLGVARGVFAELCDANPAKAPVGPPRRRAHRASYYPVGREKQNGQKQPQQNARWACRAHPDGREHPTTTAFLHCTRTKKAFGKRVSRKPFKLNRHRPLPHLNTPYAAP